MTWYHTHKHTSSYGDRAADTVAAFLGSWRFVWIQTAVMLLWVAGNVYLLFHFDPFPFVFLNLFMSAEAAFSTPLVLMSQNRQADRDRHQADADYLTNTIALEEIRNTQKDVETLLENFKKFFDAYAEDRTKTVAAAQDYILATMKAHGRQSTKQKRSS